jgi:general secretion pathway protein I
MRRRRSCDRGVRGFTLLEILVALAILAVSIGVLTASFSMSVDGTRTARRELDVAAAAQSVLARVGADIPVRAGALSGSAGEGLRWQINIAPYGDPNASPGLLVAAFEVSLEIQWEEDGRSRALTVKTLRLAPKG